MFHRQNSKEPRNAKLTPLRIRTKPAAFKTLGYHFSIWVKCLLCGESKASRIFLLVGWDSGQLWVPLTIVSSQEESNLLRQNLAEN